MIIIFENILKKHGHNEQDKYEWLEWNNGKLTIENISPKNTPIKNKNFVLSATIPLFVEFVVIVDVDVDVDVDVSNEVIGVVVIGVVVIGVVVVGRVPIPPPPYISSSCFSITGGGISSGIFFVM